MEKNKYLLINLASTVVVLIVNITINFILSPYIISNIGEEAFGYIALANNFISYAMIFTSSINSLANRFITVEIHKNSTKNASEFFTSIFIANLIIVILMLFPSIIIIQNLNNLISIKSNLLFDVQLLFAILFINFFISLIFGVFTVATYSTNKLYLQSIKNLNSSLIKLSFLFLLFSMFSAKIYYVAIATIVSNIYFSLSNYQLKRKLLPEFNINFKIFSFQKIWRVFSSGIWNSITNLGNVLTDGLDLIITNIYISPLMMGVVSISKVPSLIFNNFISSVSSIFHPQMTFYFAKNDTNSIVLELKKAMKITSIFGSIPFAFILIYGKPFLSLWIPGTDIETIYILSVLSFLNVFVAGIINPMYAIYSITNNLKVDSIVRVLSGIFSTIIVILLLNKTNLGVYAVVGVSALVGVILGFIFVPMYVSKCLNVKKGTFYPTIFSYFNSTMITIIAFSILRTFFYVNTWIQLLLIIFICGIFGLVINYIFLLNKNEKDFIVYYINKINWRKYE